MTQKVYKTAQGRTVDMGALMLQNEGVKAVGNMGVNARGDRVDPVGNVTDSKNSRVTRAYNDQMSNVRDAPVPTSARAAAPRPASKPVADVIPGFDDPLVEPPVVAEDPEVVAPEAAAPESSSARRATGGLAAAIAKSKTVKQEPLKTAKQTERDISGVRRI